VRVPWRWVRFTAGLVITSVCLWLALRHVHIEGVINAAAQAQWSWLSLALIALTADYGVRIYRWWWLLRLCNSEVTLRSCAWPLIVSFAVNNVLPFRAGDALRVIGFRDQLRSTGTWVLATLLIERMLDLTVLLGFFLLGILGLGNESVSVLYMRTAVVVSCVGAGAWLTLFLMGDRLKAVLLRLGHSKSASVRNLVRRAEQPIQQLFLALSVIRVPHRILKLIGMSAIVWMGEGGVFFAIAHAVQYDGRAFGPLFALATGSLSTLVPSSPGFVGTFDYFTISGLTAYGASGPVSTAAAFIIHIVLWLPLTAAGMAYLLFSSLRGQRGQSVTNQTQGQERM
jgi:glycosyltransferase 2 family protein